MGKRQCTEEDIQMANKCMKRCSTSLAVREMHIKITVRAPAAFTRMVKIKSRANTKCWWDCGETGSVIPCWWELGIGPPLGTQSGSSFINKACSSHMTQALLETHPHAVKTQVHTKTCTQMFICNGLKLHPAWMPFNKRRVQRAMLCSHHGILLSNKKEQATGTPLGWNLQRFVSDISLHHFPGLAGFLRFFVPCTSCVSDQRLI